MLTTVLSFSASDAETRLRWPAWRAPIVGTSPTDCPARRQLATRSRSSAAVATTSGRAPVAPLATAVPDPLPDHGQTAGIAVLRIREGSRFDFGRVAARRLYHERRELGEFLDEARLAACAQAEHVVDDEHLAVAVNPGADADRRDR